MQREGSDFTELDRAVVQAAALCEQLASPVEGLDNSARLLLNVLQAFPIQVVICPA